MTALLHSDDNRVVFVDFGSAAPPPAAEPDSAWWPWAGEAAVEPPREEPPAVTRTLLPARWSPRPLAVLADRFRRSQLAADLRRYRGRIEFLLYALAGCYLADHLFPLIHLFGGN